jgi:hypothetical protein
MTATKFQSSLDFLPEAMVEEMLRKHDGVISNTREQIKRISEIRKTIKNKLEDIALLKNVNEVLHQKSYPTTVGIDGAYVVINQLSLDTVAVAAVAVEGLIPPKEEKPWNLPRHLLNVFPVEHYSDTRSIVRAIMFSYELELASQAPHNVVYLDGSLTSQLIATGMGLTAIERTKKSGERPPPELENCICERLKATLENYIKILASSKIDQIHVGIPKYSSRNEVINELQKHDLDYPIFQKLNDKGLLSVTLRAGDVVGPIKLTREERDRWHLSGLPSEFRDYGKQIIELLEDIYVVYFKPTMAHPALRLEVSGEIARNERRISILLDSLLDQARIPGVLEPYPIHIADMFVKQVYGSLTELRDATLSDIGEIPGMDFSDVFMYLHDYRTEGGF